MPVLFFLYFVVFVFVDMFFVLGGEPIFPWILFWSGGCLVFSVANVMVYFFCGGREMPCRVNHDGESPDLLFVFYGKNLIYRSTIGMIPFFMTVFNRFCYSSDRICHVLAKRASGRKLFENWLMVILFGAYMFFYVNELSTVKAHLVILFFVEFVALNVTSFIERGLANHG